MAAKLLAPRVVEVGGLRTLCWSLPNLCAYYAFMSFLDSEMGSSQFHVRDKVRKDSSVFTEVSYKPEVASTVMFAVYLTKKLLDEVSAVSEVADAG